MKQQFSFRLDATTVLSLVLASALWSQGSVSKFPPEGWQDSDSFVVHASGQADKELTKPADQRRSARKNALMLAKVRCYEKFIGERLAAGLNYSAKAMRREYGAVIDGGKIAAIRWEDDRLCTIAFRVESPGLKDRIYRWMPEGK